MNVEAVPVLVSVFALVVSAYGILERRSATERDLRDRLLSTVDELHELSVQEHELTQEGVAENWNQIGAMAAQRMRLVQQALLLERMIKGRRLTSEEYATIAAACESSGDLDQALTLWKRAANLAADGSVVAQAANWRSMAGCHCQRGEYPAMRQAIARALDLVPVWHDRGRYEYAMTCVDLAEGEWIAGNGESPEFRNAMSMALDKAALVTSVEARATVMDRLSGIRARADAALRR